MNAITKRLIDTAFGPDGAWLVRGTHDANDKLRVIQEGPSGSFPLPSHDDLYYCVSKVGPGGRTDVRRVMVMVIDDVGKEIDQCDFDMLSPLEPSFVVESSAGSFQYMYVIRGGMDPNDYAALRQAMKADPVWGKAHGSDAAHIFRLPEGTNTKSTRNQHRVRGYGGGNVYDEAQVWGFAPKGPGTSSSQGTSSVPDEMVSPERLADLVRIIPNPADASRDYWVAAGHAIWGASAGGAYDVFEEWSSRWTANDTDANRRLWDSITASRTGRGWLRREAGLADAEAAGRWAGKEAGDAFDDGVEHPAQTAPAVTCIDPVQQDVADSIYRVDGIRLRFNHDSGCWHVFNGSVWEPLPKSVKAGFRLAERWAARNKGTLSPGDFKAVTKANFYDGVENILRQRLVVRQADFDVDPWLLGTPGGTVELKTGRLRAARAGDFISKSTAVAPFSSDNCPRWKKFVKEITKGDMAAQWFIQQWFGYCLSGDTSEQKFLFLYGPGGNGKSVLVDTMAWVLGGYFAKPVADLYFKKSMARHMQEVAMLAGARMVSISEVPSGSAWDEGRLKDHTGGGKVTANWMRENSFSFVPQFKLTVQGNHQPTFPGGINPAIKRRFRMMLLDFVPAVVDSTLEEVFRGEAEGILRWAIDGLQGWHKTRLMVPSCVDVVTDEFVADQDILAAWLGDRVEKAAGALSPVEPMWRDWIEYRDAHDAHSELYTTTKSFSTEMERRGYSKSRTKTAMGFRDIRLKSKAKSAFDDE